MSLLTRVWICDNENKRIMYDFATHKVIGYHKPKQPSKLVIKVLAICIAVSGVSSSLAAFVRVFRRETAKTIPLIRYSNFPQLAMWYLISIVIGGFLLSMLIQNELERSGKLYQDLDDTDLRKAFTLLRQAYIKQFKIKEKNIYSKKFNFKLFSIIMLTFVCGFLFLNFFNIFAIYDDSIFVAGALIFLTWCGFVPIFYMLIIYIERLLIEKHLCKREAKNTGVNK
ncbi:hypothetical protein [Bombilactobacillus thymidiniphilus]|uniref:DUF443 family protein n=1 Tax=Bombilactobacillus thymidiniphilus TaxID=2923363 RepID=A0ABY4PC19_9LACO|nr:hypothetical protein [Bombilactobacillus thymidiniphilus]UQS83189.1 hypothetical protein MOO47_05225 [Bombilactobacillus thymidiniphilus]